MWRPTLYIYIYTHIYVYIFLYANDTPVFCFIVLRVQDTTSAIFLQMATDTAESCRMWLYELSCDSCFFFFFCCSPDIIPSLYERKHTRRSVFVPFLRLTSASIYFQSARAVCLSVFAKSFSAECLCEHVDGQPWLQFVESESVNGSVFSSDEFSLAVGFDRAENFQ